MVEEVEQLRVLRLVDGGSLMVDEKQAVSMEHEASPHTYTVEIWQRRPIGKGRRTEWMLVRSTTPLRRGKPLTAIPFVFHGPSHSRAAVERPPIADLVAANLDHYRLNTDYKHGMHFTALPTAFLSGCDRSANSYSYSSS